MVGDEVVISGRYARAEEAKAPSPGGGGGARFGFAGDLVEVPELGVSVKVQLHGAWVPVEDSAHNHVETQG